MGECRKCTYLGCEEGILCWCKKGVWCEDGKKRVYFKTSVDKNSPRVQQFGERCRHYENVNHQAVHVRSFSSVVGLPGGSSVRQDARAFVPNNGNVVRSSQGVRSQTGSDSGLRRVERDMEARLRAIVRSQTPQRHPQQEESNSGDHRNVASGGVAGTHHGSEDQSGGGNSL